MLPVEALADRILEKIDDNRVTIIIGATGCGKSTQVPKLIRHHLKKRVLCVQPRRMAVVAVATRVAQELGESLGGAAVGYHIGAALEARRDQTQLLFVTAGIFLEELNMNGVEALQGYGCVVIDEVHERSCENDLALVCMLRLINSTRELRSLKIVLMSATADVRRYVEFVKRLSGDSESASTFALGESAIVHNLATKYLDDAIAEAGVGGRLQMDTLLKQDRPALQELLSLITALTPKLIQRTVTEDGLGCTVLIFLPTYSSIEELHSRLELTLPGIPLYVLHSSVRRIGVQTHAAQSMWDELELLPMPPSQPPSRVAQWACDSSSRPVLAA